MSSPSGLPHWSQSRRLWQLLCMRLLNGPSQQRGLLNTSTSLAPEHCAGIGAYPETPAVAGKIIAVDKIAALPRSLERSPGVGFKRLPNCCLLYRVRGRSTRPRERRQPHQAAHMTLCR